MLQRRNDIRREIFVQIKKEKGQVYFVYLGLSLLMSCAKRSAEKEKSLYCKPVQTQFLLQTKSLVETINTSTGVNQLLLAGIERVALGADFNTDLLLGGAGGEGVAASATDGGLLVLRMDAFFHVVHLFLVS